MELEWVLDEEYIDTWDLRNMDHDIFGFIMRVRADRCLEWCPTTGADIELPGLTVEEAKAVVEAMIRLEG
jgi:hypothetical protein